MYLTTNNMFVTNHIILVHSILNNNYLTIKIINNNTFFLSTSKKLGIFGGSLGTEGCSSIREFRKFMNSIETLNNTTR